MNELDRALQSTLAVLGKVGPADLDAPTPCASWNIRALVNHFVGTMRWWAATITGEGEDPFADYVAGDAITAYEDGIKVLLAASELDGVMDRPVHLDIGEFPGAVVLGFAAIEQFTHGWDLARALGQPAELDPQLALSLLGQARLAVGDTFRGPDGQALFGPEREAPAEAGPAGQLAAFLGRSV